MKALAPDFLLRPYQGLQPLQVPLLGDIDGVHIDACTPDHLGNPARSGGLATQFAVEHHVRGLRRVHADLPARLLIGVAVSVGVEAEPGGGADSE